MTTRPPVPPFTLESATQEVRLAKDSWNSRDPEKVSQGYTLDSRRRNRSEFVAGRQDIIAFLTRKWTRELDYRLIKELWAFALPSLRGSTPRRSTFGVVRALFPR
jgi:uncharacterized protein